MTESPVVKHQYYSEDDDEFIFDYIMKYGGEYGEKRSLLGNQIWKEMEKKKITTHSWQSMKDRYLKHIQHFPPDVSNNILTLNMYRGKPIRCLNLSSSTTVRNDKYGNKQTVTVEKKLKKTKTIKEEQILVCSLCNTSFDINSNSFHICTVDEHPVVNNRVRHDYLLDVFDSMTVNEQLDQGLFSSSTSSSLSSSFPSEEESFYTCSEGEELDVNENDEILQK